jgi:hypothetical protein
MAEQTLEVPKGRMCAFGERREGRLVLDDRAALRARRFHYMGTMTDNAPGTHSKVIGSSPSVWAHTVPGADTVTQRACR